MEVQPWRRLHTMKDVCPYKTKCPKHKTMNVGECKSETEGPTSIKEVKDQPNQNREETHHTRMESPSLDNKGRCHHN